MVDIIQHMVFSYGRHYQAHGLPILFSLPLDVRQSRDNSNKIQKGTENILVSSSSWVLLLWIQI